MKAKKQPNEIPIAIAIEILDGLDSELLLIFSRRQFMAASLSFNFS